MCKKVLTLLFLFALNFVSIAQNESTDIYSIMQRNDLKLTEIEQLANDYFDKLGNRQNADYKHYQRWLYEQKFHTTDKGYLRSLEDEYQSFLLSEAVKRNKASVRAPYTELGPATFNVTSSWNPGGGRCWTAAIHPSDENTIYIGTDGGGLWKTTNGGSSWSNLTDFLSSSWQAFYHITIDPANTSVVYAGLKTGGVLKSINGGATWNTTGAGPSSIKRIRVHPGNSNIIFATASNGIWRSIDGGAVWNQQLATSKEDITFKPDDANIMYSSGSGSPTFHRSTDNGVTWTAVTSGITASGRSLIGVSPADPNIVYIVQASGSLFGRMLRSTDGGLNFTTTVTGSAASGTQYFGYEPNGTGTTGQATHDMAIAVNPTNANEVHIAGIICWVSTNGGTSFTATTDWDYPNAIGYNHADVHSLQFVNATLYSTSDGGIYKSVNNAGDWTNLTGNMGIRQFYKIATANTNANVIAGGAQDNGSVFRKTTGLWYEWLGADGMDCIISPTNSSVAIGTSQYGSIYRTINAGDSYTNLTNPSSGNWVTPLAWHPTDGNIVYGGWTGIYKSTNQGSTWTKISGTVIASALNCLAVAPSNAQYIYGSVGGTLYRTTNDGASWASTALGATISSIFVSPLNPSKVWITTTASSGNVLVSSDAGATFTSISAGLPSMAARSIVVDNNAEESIYVGMNIGVYYKDNVNTAWVLLGSGLPNVAVNEIEINEISGKLRVGTYGRGVWETDLVVLQQPCNAPASLSVSNITTTSATINWTAVPGAASYEVNYRIQGNTTWTVINVTTNNVNLTSLLASTIYEYQVRADCGANGNSTFSSGTFTTSTPASCGNPSSVSAINTSADAVNISWAAVIDATSYIVEYKLTTSSVWTSSTVSSTSLLLTSLAAGKYNVRVSAVCPSGNGIPTSGNDFLSHCAVSGISSTEHIDLVGLGNISRSSGNDGGYFYVANQVTNLVRSSSNTISFSSGFSGAATSERFAIYIDYNQDGDFLDANELVAQRTNTNGNVFTRTFTIPSGAVLGETRMRVTMRRGSANATSCQTSYNGEIEDYRVNIVATADKENELSIAEDKVVIYPVPASDIVNLSYIAKKDGKLMTYIYGMDGSIYKTNQHHVAAGTNTLMVDVSGIINGNYIVKIVKDNEVHHCKMVIIH